MKYHLRLDIKGAIRNKAFKGFTDNEGKTISPKIAEAHLRIMDYEGKRYMKIGDCNNWDEENGCLGHEDVENDNTSTGSKDGENGK